MFPNELLTLAVDQLLVESHEGTLIMTLSKENHVLFRTVVQIMLLFHDLLYPLAQNGLIFLKVAQSRLESAVKCLIHIHLFFEPMLVPKEERGVNLRMLDPAQNSRLDIELGIELL